jgi:hypothetical protein
VEIARQTHHGPRSRTQTGGQRLRRALKLLQLVLCRRISIRSLHCGAYELGADIALGEVSLVHKVFGYLFTIERYAPIPSCVTRCVTAPSAAKPGTTLASPNQSRCAVYRGRTRRRLRALQIRAEAPTAQWLLPAPSLVRKFARPAPTQSSTKRYGRPPLQGSRRKALEKHRKSASARAQSECRRGEICGRRFVVRKL